jgi:hypothetical protein
VSKETQLCQKRPNSVKRDLIVSKEQAEEESKQACILKKAVVSDFTY